ncbi:hypothetical protein ABIF68_003517 [Bradyrhizobium japonicum]|nr:MULTISPECIES: hypothetical protein [Bradyrhizobium]MDI2077962.1 hypothetical protein [Bradyrhizobium sp. Mp27]
MDEGKYTGLENRLDGEAIVASKPVAVFDWKCTRGTRAASLR